MVKGVKGFYRDWFFCVGANVVITNKKDLPRSCLSAKCSWSDEMAYVYEWGYVKRKGFFKSYVKAMPKGFIKGKSIRLGDIIKK